MGQEFRYKWFIKEVIPRQTGQGMGKQARKGGGGRQGPAEGGPRLSPRGALEGQAHVRAAPPGSKKAGSEHTCSIRHWLRGLRAHGGAGGGKHKPP